MLIVNPKLWLAAVLLVTVLAVIFAETIPSNSPVYYVRYFFGFVFVAILPGYCLVNLLFSKNYNLDLPEEAVLSVALSFGIAGLTGLFLGLTIGINFNSIIVSLSAIVVILAILAYIRKEKLRIKKASDATL